MQEQQKQSKNSQLKNVQRKPALWHHNIKSPPVTAAFHIRTPVQLPAAPFQSQLPANIIGEAAEDAPTT